MSAEPVEGTCVPRLHAHVGVCYRQGLRDGYEQGRAAAQDTADPADGLSDDERDQLAEALRHEWGGGRHRYMVWGDLPEPDKDRWREEVDLLPIADIIAARQRPTRHADTDRAAVEAVIEAVEALPGPNGVGIAGWPASSQAAYFLAIEEAVGAIRAAIAAASDPESRTP